MSLPTPNWSIENNAHRPNHDLILAPVPLRRGFPMPGYSGFVSRPDGTIAPGTWNCSCANSFGSAYGIKDAAASAGTGGTVQAGAFYSELNCGGQPQGCVDPSALTYDRNAQVGDQLSCIYPNATSNIDCQSARAPNSGCKRVPWKHSHN